MKRLFIHTMLLLSVTVSTLSILSCSDNDDISTGDNNGLTAQVDSAKAEALLYVLQGTASVDTLSAKWPDTYEPTIGSVVDDAHPYVRYVAVDDTLEAINLFAAIAPIDDIDINTTSKTWSLDGVGSLTFSLKGESDCIATIDVNISQMPHLTQIRLVPESAMDENAGIKNPYYSTGDVVFRNSDKTYWICIRGCGGSKGKSHWANFVASTSDNYQTYFDGRVVLPKSEVLSKSKGEARKHLGDLAKLMALVSNPTAYFKSISSARQNSIEYAEQLQKFQTDSVIWSHYGIFDMAFPVNINIDNFKGKTSFNFIYGTDYSSLFKKVTLNVKEFSTLDDNPVWFSSVRDRKYTFGVTPSAEGR